MGEPLVRSGTLGPAILSPIYRNQITRDPVRQEVARLQVGLKTVPHKLNGVDLTPEQYSRFAYTSGKPAKAVLDAMIADSDWERLPDGLRRVVIREVVSRFRGANCLLGEALFLRAALARAVLIQNELFTSSGYADHSLAKGTLSVEAAGSLTYHTRRPRSRVS